MNVSENEWDLDLLKARSKRVMRHVWKHFKEDRLFEEAASLSYTSLLALVPLLAVIFGVVSAFPVFSQWAVQVQSFIFVNFVPAAGETVRGHLETFLQSVTDLTLPGTVVLILTALLLMFRIEVAFNKIWRVTEARTLTNRIVMYWAVLTLSPIMIGAAVALGAQNALAALHLQEGVPQWLQRVGIFLLMWMTFTLIFALVPNRKVKFLSALAGAFLSAVLLEIAKAAFVGYVKNANYTVIYGALATVPIFLFWLYLVWTVILFGASLSASLTTFKDRSRSEFEWPRRLELQLAFRVIGHLWEAQRRGRGMFVSQIMEVEKRGTELQLRDLLLRLKDADFVSYQSEGGWFLTRDLGDSTFLDLAKSGAFYLPLAEVDGCLKTGKWDAAFCAALTAIRERGQGALNLSLRQMYQA